MYRAVLIFVVFLCVNGLRSYADGVDGNVAALMTANVARSEILQQNCRRLYQLQGDRYTCGFLRVPENYTDKDSTLIKIPFLVISPDPTVFDKTLEPLLVTGGGGPGNALLGTQDYRLTNDEFWTYEEMSVADGRPLVLLENRGVGLSQPNLDCHYSAEVFTGDFWQVVFNTDLACGRNHTDDGIDLSQFNVRNAAFDIEMFRRLFNTGVGSSRQINLYGISYGTHVAMTYERLFPQATRVMVLDSVVANDKHSIELELAYAQRSLDLVFSKCRADSDCRASFGVTLENDFYRYLKNLDNRSKVLVVTWADTERPLMIKLTGSLVVNVIHGMLYSSDSFASIPLLVSTMINGSYKQITTGVHDYIDTYSARYAFADSAFLTYRCFDQNYSDKSNRDLSGHKLFPYWDLARSQRYMEKICAEYGIVAETRGLDSRAVSDTPTLYFSGELDPVTPPASADKAALKSTYHWDIVRENISHDVVSHSGCARLLASWFVYHPQEDLDSRAAGCEPSRNRLVFPVR